MERRDKGLEELGDRLKAAAPAKPAMFPDIKPSSIRRSAVWDLWANDLDSEEDAELLLHLAFQHPEGEFHIFNFEDEPMPSTVRAAIDGGQLLVTETQMSWYEHPRWPGNYVHIGRHPEWDWQKEVLEKGRPMLRHEVVLSDFERRRREHAELTAAIADAVNPKPTSLYGRVSAHYNRHQLAYWIPGTILGLIGLFLAL
jgi:hypothetical protein